MFSSDSRGYFRTFEETIFFAGSPCPPDRPSGGSAVRLPSANQGLPVSDGTAEGMPTARSVGKKALSFGKSHILQVCNKVIFDLR